MSKATWNFQKQRWDEPIPVRERWWAKFFGIWPVTPARVAIREILERPPLGMALTGFIWGPLALISLLASGPKHGLWGDDLSVAQNNEVIAAQSVSIGKTYLSQHDAKEPKPPEELPFSKRFQKKFKRKYVFELQQWKIDHGNWQADRNFIENKIAEHSRGVSSSWLPWGAEQPPGLAKKKFWMAAYHANHFLSSSIWGFQLHVYLLVGLVLGFHDVQTRKREKLEAEARNVEEAQKEARCQLAWDKRREQEAKQRELEEIKRIEDNARLQEEYESQLAAHGMKRVQVQGHTFVIKKGRRLPGIKKRI